MIFISNPPACIENFIVLRDGCYCVNGVQVPTPVPTSGYYIESLKGITIENLSDIVSEANQNATDLVNQMVYFAAALVEKQLLALLAESGLDMNKLGHTREYCSVKTTFALPAFGVQKGIRISRAAIHSPQSRIYVQKVKIKAQNTGATTIYIKDILGNVLWSQALNVTANVLTIVDVNMGFEPDIIYIVADATNLGLNEWACYGPAGCCGSPVLERKELSIMGFDGLQNSMIGFLGACVRLDCTDENIICQFAKRLSMSILYQTGAELLKEWVSPSSRINFIKTNGKEWAAETIDSWQQMSIDLLKAEVKNIINIIKQDKYCYTCNNSLQSFAKLPS